VVVLRLLSRQLPLRHLPSAACHQQQQAMCAHNLNNQEQTAPSSSLKHAAGVAGAAPF
jgi:hypothetical protein